MQERTWSKKGVSWLAMLVSSLFLLAACSPATTSTSRVTPESDCLPDLPCVPCIIPIPYYPVTAETQAKISQTVNIPNK